MINNPNLSLKHNVIEFKIDDLFDSRRGIGNQYKLPIISVIVRVIDGVEYLFGSYHLNLVIFGKNEMTNAYLPIRGENIEDIILKLITNDNDKFTDIDEYGKPITIDVDGDILYAINTMESIEAIKSIAKPSNESKSIPYEEYVNTLKTFLGEAVSSDQLKSVDSETYITLTSKFLSFGKKRTTDLDVVSKLDDFSQAKLYLMQLAFVDRCRFATQIILQLSKTAFRNSIE